MKKLISIIIAVVLVVCILPINAFAAGGLSVSTGSLELQSGDSKTFTVTANNCAGQISVSSSNTSVAKVSVDGDSWLDNNSVTVTVKAVGNGNASIVVKAVDMVTGNDEDISGQAKNVNIKVAAPTTTTTKAPETTKATTTTTKAPETTTSAPEITKAIQTVSEISEISILAAEKVDLDIAKGTYEYDILVPDGTTSLVVDPTVENGTKVEIVGADAISDGSKVQINLTATDGTVTTYTINVRYAPKEVVEKVENSGTPTWLTAVIAVVCFIAGLIVGIIIGILIGKRKYESYTYYTPDESDAVPDIIGDDYDDGDDSYVSPFATSGFNFATVGGFNYDFANDYDDEEEEAQSLRDPVYTEAPVEETIEEPETPSFVPPAFETPAPVEEPVAAPVVETVAPTPAYVEPVVETPAPEMPVVEPVAPAPVVEIPTVEVPVVEPIATAPVVEIPTPAAPVVEPVASATPSFVQTVEPVVLPTPEPAPVEPVVETTPEPAIEITPEPAVATPYIDDAPPVLPYEAGKAFGENPFEQSAD